MHRLAKYVGLIFAAASFGVVVAYAVSGSTLSDWRLNFGLAPILLFPSFIIILLSSISGRISTQNFSSEFFSPSSTDEQQLDDGENLDDGDGSIAPSLSASAELSEYMTTAAFLLRYPFISFNLVSLAASTLCLAAFATLLPTYIQKRFGASNDTASYIMAGTVPLLVAGSVAGGVWCRHYHYGLRKQLLLTVVANACSIPMMFIFFISDLNGFILLLLLAMFVISFNNAPQLTLLSSAAEYVAIKKIVNRDDMTITVQLSMEVSQISDRYNSVVNSVAAIAVRLLGTIPGPILLSTLLDNAGMDVQYPFLIVGASMAVLMFVFSLAAWKNCPRDADPDVQEFHVEVIKAEAALMFPI